MTSLRTRAYRSIVILYAVMAALLFGTAGTLLYWQGWVWLALCCGSAVLTTNFLLKHDPRLLDRRLKGGPFAEKRKAQKAIMAIAVLVFVALLAIPALSYRFGLEHLPLWLEIAGACLVVVGPYIVFLVYKENSFTSATIEVAAEQKVVTSGPYALVRHPMYAGSLFYLLGTPLALGSALGLLAFAAMVPVLILRMFDEEKLLQKDLAGYSDYKNTVKYRLLPRVW